MKCELQARLGKVRGGVLFVSSAASLIPAPYGPRAACRAHRVQPAVRTACCLLPAACSSPTSLLGRLIGFGNLLAQPALRYAPYPTCLAQPALRYAPYPTCLAQPALRFNTQIHRHTHAHTHTRAYAYARSRALCAVPNLACTADPSLQPTLRCTLDPAQCPVHTPAAPTYCRPLRIPYCHPPHKPRQIRRRLFSHQSIYQHAGTDITIRARPRAGRRAGGGAGLCVGREHPSMGRGLGQSRSHHARIPCRRVFVECTKCVPQEVGV